MTITRLTGLILILVPLAFNGLFFALGRAYEYPGILRKPTAYILERFTAGGGRLIALWYAFAVTALLAIPIALLFQLVFAEQSPQLAAMSAIIGVLSGLVQALGLLRWPLLAPALAAQHQAKDSTPAQREAVEVVFHAFHTYAGVIVGEHLGYLFTGAWTLMISAMMASSPLFGGLMALLGVVSALGILAGMLEPAGWKLAGMINALSYILWSVWLVLSGLILMFA